MTVPSAPPAPSTEPFRSRWERRARTIPIMLGATALATVVAPLALPLLAAADLVRGRRRLPSARVFVFALQYVWNDSVEILLAGPYWVLAGFGRRLRSPASIARHQRLQHWSLRTLARRGEQFLGLRFVIDDGAEFGDGPAVVVCRHVSLVDASLPAWCYLERGIAVRGVIMAELLADPGFDLIYGRLGNVFVPRDNGPEAVAAIAPVAAALDERTVAVIFPEGRLFRPELMERAILGVAKRDPERAERLAGLRHVLPTRPGGFLGLVAGAPTADVVVIDHRGLDRFARFADLARAVPLAEPVRVTARRYRRADLPTDPSGVVRWLDDRWLELDEALAAERRVQGSGHG